MRILFAMAIAIGILASCRSTKKIQTAIAKKDTTVAVSVHDDKTDSILFIKNVVHQIDSNQLHFKTFSAKIEVDYSDASNKKYNVNAILRMYKDSAIWISANAILGIEAMRVLITKDSVFLLNKLEKSFTKRSVDYLQEVVSMPLNLSALQNLIIGNVVFLDSNNIVSYSKNNNNTLSLLSIGQYFKNFLTLNDQDRLLLHSKLDDIDAARSRTADLSYSDYETKRGPLFSTRRKITVAEKNKVDVAMNFKQYDFDQEVSFPFSVPKNYKRK